MILEQDKSFIKCAICGLLKEIDGKSRGNFRLKDKSLYLWCIYQKFVHEILNLYTIEDMEKLKEIVDYLKLEKFFIDANKEFNEEENRIHEYIKSIQEKLDSNCSI